MWREAVVKSIRFIDTTLVLRGVIQEHKNLELSTHFCFSTPEVPEILYVALALNYLINFTPPFQNKCKQIWHKI
jgi:hypothetical protein